MSSDLQLTDTVQKLLDGDAEEKSVIKPANTGFN